ncbi:right-handed parallel beta-helix repeat-containing protein [Deinococcus maricopensis]|uniref:Pectate lyase superfamily protein domain-containing protein n=1 Tax=Deinococcus maricopensis (strain DSM 21211 / LMG 22137 / NRRL B-23946 / LB-34) TaxID=709986 RepID=E8U3F3_DEIML|nr:right-handed parallel beta-helix repeat-containing protein [Deinococcus maricopensis]ADV65824.1 hypothetical protein Deima_0160 [Deinococcus maricopensis DSM 21211]
MTSIAPDRAAPAARTTLAVVTTTALLSVGLVTAPHVDPPAHPSLAALASLAAPARTAPVNVRDYGARGDGTTDDTAALNRAAQAAAGRRDLLFPPGTYLTRGPVHLQNYHDQAILGDGATLKAGRGYARGNLDGMLHLTRPVNVTVRGLRIVGERDPRADPYHVNIDGVRVMNGRNVTVVGVTVVQAPTNGVAFIDCDGVTTRQSTFQSAGGAGGWASRTTNQRWQNNAFVGFGAPNGNPSGGLGLFATLGEYFLAEGNSFKNLANTATKTEGLSHVTYRANTVDVFGKDGIKIMPYGPTVTSVRDALIEGNTVRHRQPWAPDGSAYILLHSVIGAKVLNNTIEGSGGTPPVYEEDAIRVNAWAGGPGARDVLIEGNQARGTRRGLRIESDGIIVRNNTVMGAAPWARSGLIVGGHGLTVSGNTFDGPVIGVLIERGITRTRIDRNRFAHVGTGVYANENNTDTVVTQNQFADVETPVVGRVSQ